MLKLVILPHGTDMIKLSFKKFGYRFNRQYRGSTKCFKCRKGIVNLQTDHTFNKTPFYADFSAFSYLKSSVKKVT